MGFSAMLAEEYILIYISLIGFIVVGLVFATSMKIIQHQHFYLSLVNGSDDSDEYQTPSGLDVTPAYADRVWP